MKPRDPVLYPPGISPPVHCINFGQVSPERSPSAHLDSPHWVDIGCDLKQENVTHWVFPFTVHISHTVPLQPKVPHSQYWLIFFLNCLFRSYVILSSMSLSHDASSLFHLQTLPEIVLFRSYLLKTSRISDLWSGFSPPAQIKCGRHWSSLTSAGLTVQIIRVTTVLLPAPEQSIIFH